MNRSSLLLTLVLIIGNAGVAEINFLKGTLAQATERARMENKPIMIDFITDWCRWCDTLDARTYSDQQVASFVNDRIVAIKIDAEKGEGIDIAARYKVQAYPTIVFTKADGEEIDRILGYVPAEPFLKTVTDYVNGVNTFSVMKEQTSGNPADPALRYALATKYLERYDWTAAADQFRKLIELDPKNTLGHHEEAWYNIAVAEFRTQNDPVQLSAYVRAYPDSPRVRQALTSLFRHYIKQKEAEKARSTFTQYLERWPDDASAMNNYAWACAENRVNLDHAAEVAGRAVALATADQKASFLDTQATVEFGRGNVDDAIRIEQEALDLLKNVPDAKKKDYLEAMAKFRAAKESKTAGGSP